MRNSFTHFPNKNIKPSLNSPHSLPSTYRPHKNHISLSHEFMQLPKLLLILSLVMFSPGFTSGRGSSNFYGRSTSFSDRSIMLPSSMNNSNIYNHNFLTIAHNLHHPYYQTQQEQQIP